MVRSKKTKTTGKKSLLGIVVLLLIGLGIFAYYKWHHPKVVPVATTSSNSSPSGDNAPTSSQKVPANSASNGGGAVDKQGQSTSSLPPASEWTISGSGKITLQTPVANAIVVSGDSLIGKASTSSVQFVLIDSKVGQIAQGQLSVVGGKFSGVLHFTSNASTGTLDIYSPNPSNGAEENFMSIPVKFNVK